MTNDTHFFSANLAAEVGIAGATILHNIARMQVQHELAETAGFEQDGRFYVRHSYESLAAWHSYLSVPQLKRIMKGLIDGGYIESAYLGKPWDRTLYWSVSPAVIHSTKSYDASVESVLSHSTKSHDVQQINNSKQYSASFDAFWQLYPRKVGKKPAADRWKKMSDADRASALEAVQSYPFGDDPKYIKHPSTWLNHECWNDERPVPPKKKWSGI